MLAAGYKQAHVARVLGYTQRHVSTIAESPLMQALIKQFQQEFTTEQLGGVVNRLEAEAQPTLDRLVSLRDYGEPDDNVKLGASRELTNLIPSLSRLRQAAKEGADRGTVHIHFGSGDLRSLASAAAEDAVPVPAIPVTPLDDFIEAPPEAPHEDDDTV
jgi:hypothetical protein